VSSTGCGRAAHRQHQRPGRERALLPIARRASLAGRILADTVKQAWSIALLLGVGSILGFRVGNGVLGVVGAFALLLAFTLAASWISVLVGGPVAGPVLQTLLWGTGIAVIFAPLAVRGLKRRV
jgi:hypothetical protein